jgi:hypothetical protein
LKDIGGKRAAVDIEFDAKIAGVGDPGDLVAGVENDDLRYKSNEYGALCHCSSAPWLSHSAKRDFSLRSK